MQGLKSRNGRIRERLVGTTSTSPPTSTPFLKEYGDDVERYDSSPGQAKNEHCPELDGWYEFLPFRVVCRAEAGAADHAKGKVGCGRALPRAAASAALLWATIVLPRWGAGWANQPFQRPAGFRPSRLVAQ